jgi:hypothetical protein
MTITIRPDSPSWVEDIDVADLGTPDEWVALNGLLATASPVIHCDRMTRDQELRLVGWQYNVGQGDVPANTPVIELMTAPIDGESSLCHTGLFLTVDVVPLVIDALTESLAKLGHTRETEIRKAGKWIVETAEASK